MSFLASIAAQSILLFGLVLLAAEVAAYTIGHLLGERRSRHPDAQPESVGFIVAGMLGLLAFVLALTLSFANTRFSERRAGTLAEANAIGTAWLRAEAVGGARGEEIARLLEQYLRVREGFARAERNSPDIDELNRQTNSLQSAVWGHAAVIVREQPNPVSASLMSSLNDAFDAATAERFAFALGLPPQIFWLLISLTLMSAASVGYQLGLRRSGQHALVLLLGAMWAIVIVNILDLASARLGNFRTDISVYEWTRQSMQGGLTIPPPPASR